MSPTNGSKVEGVEEIRSRHHQALTSNNSDTYKEYGYRRVPIDASGPPEKSSPSVDDCSTRESVRLVFGREKEEDNDGIDYIKTTCTEANRSVYQRIPQHDMAEEGSKLLQYVAATAGSLFLLFHC